MYNATNKFYSAGKPGTCIHVYNAYTMSDVYKILDDIGQNIYKKKGETVGRPFWFRGQEKEEFTLLPSLYRERDNEPNAAGYYSKFSLAEEYRHQNFAARVNHLTHSQPKSKVEWQEVLQHHFGKTRFMDWSESVETAVNFALEPFLDTKNSMDNEIKRSEITPGIWVLDPYMLNEHVYDFFASSENLEYIERALENLFPQNKDRTQIAAEMRKELEGNKEIYFNFDNSKVIDVAINGLVCVCVLDEHYHYNAGHLANMIRSKEFNPFFYLLVRYYSDALPVKADLFEELLPPLASVQPYHSERIRTQRGAFTIFPNYYRADNAKPFSGTKMDIIALESQEKIHDCFCNIRLCDPVRIARELIYAGERWPEIYPDIQVYADYLETKKFYV